MHGERTRMAGLGRRGFLAAAGGGVACVGRVDADGTRSAADAGTDGTRPAVADAPDGRARTEVVVRFEPAESSAGTDRTPAALEGHALATRSRFDAIADAHSGISVEREFWIANAVLATIDRDAVSLAEIQAIPGVTGLHANYRTRLEDLAIPTPGDGSSTHDPGESAPTESRAGAGAPSTPIPQRADASGAADRPGSTAASPDVTRALELVDAPAVWERYGTRGDGVDVAVLDTGVDPEGHDGLAASLDRGAWAAFDATGARVDSEPNDPIGHGTGVSGIVSGGQTQEGVQYGVAPDVALYHAKVVDGGLRFSAVLAGLEWALANDVDVASLSIGPLRYDHAYVEPIRNLLANDVVVVGAIANVGPGTSASPGNVYGVLGAGYVDDDRRVHPASGGERIRTERYWGEDAPDDWPASYVTPAVTAPGVDVPLSRPGGEYGTGEGASYAAPATAGVVALATAATDADAASVQDAIETTARHPGAYARFGVDPGRDTRYGSGVVSALAASSHLAATERVTGTVTTADGTPIPNAIVESETGVRTATNADGTYTLAVPTGEQGIGAHAPGYAFQSTTGRPSEIDSFDVALESTGEVTVDMTEGVGERVTPGAGTSATFDVAHVDSLTVGVETTGLVDPQHLDVSVDGTGVEFEEPVAVDAQAPGGSVSVTVAADASASVGSAVLTYEFASATGEVVGESDRVYVHHDPLPVSVSDPPTLQTPIDLVAPGTTIELRGGTTTETVDADAGHALVVDKAVTLTTADAATARIEIDADAAGADAAEASGVFVAANDVTLDGVEIDAPGVGSALQVGTGFRNRETISPSAVTIRNAVVSGATTGILAKSAPALHVTGCDVTASDVGIGVDGAQTTDVWGNTIVDVQTGIDVRGRVTSVRENTLRDVADAAIRLSTPEYATAIQQVDLGPIEHNDVTNATTGIAILGYTNAPIQHNTLTDTETAIYVEGGVLAPIQDNDITRADTAITVADDASVQTIANNALTDVTTPGAATRTTTTATTAPTTPTTATTAPTATPTQTPRTSSQPPTTAAGTDTTQPAENSPLASPTTALTTIAVVILALARALATGDGDAEP